MRRYLSVFLMIVLVLLPVFPSYASLASPSNFRKGNFSTPSDWTYDEGEITTIVDLMNAGARSSVGSVTNTVNRSDVSVRFYYYDMSNVLHFVSTPLNSQGYFSFSRPSDFVKSERVVIRITGGSLPSSGKYQFSGDFTSNTGGFTYSSSNIVLRKYQDNVANQDVIKSFSLQQASGDFYFSFSVDLATVGMIGIDILSSNLVPPYGGYLNFRFVKLSSDVEADFSSPGTSAADKTQQMQDNVTNISSGVQAMGDTLKEIVQTISNQLAALWDQMFNLMHVPHLKNDDKNTDRIVNALGDEITVQIENDDKIADDIMNNDDKNTDTIVDGFDNSGMNSNNDKLNNSLTEYDTAEDQIVDSISGYLEDFTMPSYSQAPPGVLTACVYFGNYLQRLFEGMGAFNFPITLSLTMIFVLMLIGYHRFRS